MNKFKNIKSMSSNRHTILNLRESLNKYNFDYFNFFKHNKFKKNFKKLSLSFSSKSKMEGDLRKVLP